ncbi:hypothetical protein SAMN04487844_14737 [Methylobacterium sp. yr596]|nr:hypothetical protein SAMN04487844_14737 [Methylobacterium sp. yr596]
MAPQAFRYSPFDRQSSNPAADRNAPGRPPASPPRSERPAGRTLSSEIVRHSGDDAPGEPSDLSAPGRHPSAIAETVHAQASLSDTAVGRPVSGLHARRLGDDPAGHAAGLLHLARRLERAASDAGRVARGTEILAARLSIELPQADSYEGLSGSINDHSEHAQLLADAHAVVVRLSAYPEILDVLSSLEQGAEVIVRTDESHASPSNVSGSRSCKTGAVGGEQNPTLRPRKLWSGIIDFISAGHRKSSSPAHQCAPPSVDKHHHGSRIGCGKPLAGNGQ